MKIMVTGSEGKLGSLICQALRHHDVVRYDRKRFQEEDILHTDALVDSMAGCDCVVHAAGIPHPHTGSMAHYFRINVRGTLNVLQVAHHLGVRRVIYLSSTGYYGCNIQGRLLPAYFPIDEAHPVASTLGYSVGGLEEYNQSKVMVEQLLAYFGTNRLLETCALRLAPANRKADQYPKGFDWKRMRPTGVVASSPIAIQTLQPAQLP